MISGTSRFLTRYDGLIGRLPGDPAIRAAAADMLRTSGLPGEARGRRAESWTYTSLRSLSDLVFESRTPDQAVIGTILSGLDLLSSPKITFVDGVFRSDVSVSPSRGFDLFADQPNLESLSWSGPEPMVALNTMLAENGVSLCAPAGSADELVQLINLSTGGNDTHPRHSISVGEGAHLTVVEMSAGQGSYFVNTVAEINVAKGARLNHVRIQREDANALHVSTSFVNVHADGIYDSFTLNLGSLLSRTEVHVNLIGAGAAAHLNAAQLLGGNQHADFTTVVNHAAPGCTSRQTVKSVLSGRSRGVFQGCVRVARVAQKTDGYQMNRALLLSPFAEMDSKPELEIFADDVRCSHGSTVGELDREQLFYLRSRGIPEHEAREILVRAFLDDAFDVVADETIREKLDATVRLWWERQKL